MSKKESTWDRKIEVPHGEVVLAFAICEQCAKDILTAWERMHNYPPGSKPWLAWQQVVIMYVDESMKYPVRWYVQMSGFSFKHYLSRATADSKWGEFDYDEWKKY